MPLADLVAVCHILSLDYEGAEKVLANRVCQFLINLSDREKHDDEDTETNDDNDYDEKEDSKDNQDDKREAKNSLEVEGSVSRDKTQRQQRKDDTFSLTFRDVEDSISTFNGGDQFPVEKWIDEFEELSELTGWNDLQKLIFAKKSLKGVARLLIQSEKGITTWNKLKTLLREEFQVNVSRAQVHKMLMTRKKRREEPEQEYVLIMPEIGSRAEIEPEVVVQYIIDGIIDDATNKIILYGAKTFAEFKEKIKIYQQIKSRNLLPNTSAHSEKTKNCQQLFDAPCEENEVEGRVNDVIKV